MHLLWAILWRRLWPLWLHRIFRHYLINGAIFGRKLLKMKCVISLQILSKTFLILRRIRRDIVINVKKCSCKVPVILVGLEWNINFLDRFTERSSNIKFHKNSSSGSRVPCGRTDGHEANSRFFLQFCERAQNITSCSDRMLWSSLLLNPPLTGVNVTFLLLMTSGF